MLTLAALILLAASEPRLIVLHSVDQRVIIINTAQVTSMREAREAKDPNKLFTEGVECWIGLTDGRYFTVIESCETVRNLIEQHKEEPR